MSKHALLEEAVTVVFWRAPPLYNMTQKAHHLGAPHAGGPPAREPVCCLAGYHTMPADVQVLRCRLPSISSC